MTSFRYMGTKKYLALKVKRSIELASKSGHVADLFSGMGAVAREFSSSRPMYLNDALTFPTICSKAYFLDNSLKIDDQLLKKLYGLFRDHRTELKNVFKRRIQRERNAIEKGINTLAEWMIHAPHVGNSVHYQKMKSAAKKAEGIYHYQLTTLYYSGSYFSTTQAIDLDALRFAIDGVCKLEDNYPLITIWLATASILINSPGHSAQYLKPNSPSSYSKIKNGFSRDVWATFIGLLDDYSPCGNSSWRRKNMVSKNDALLLLEKGLPEEVSIVYADPPYTNDQYSRYYHVFETLLLYNFPDSTGCGRYPEGRFSSPFCLKTKIVNAFEQLFCGVFDHSIPLVLSYPSDGLLSKVGVDVVEFANDMFAKVEVIENQISHSTMGASKGSQKKSAVEYILTCHPA
ncbi:DNA adenine methylase [Marinicella meishanensis]|uniref:DNA adenine methylase n=1 Tax=Marinicella meishanensis TaxID=2873263 RepID=UPI001CBCC2D0|nr:DNA adenine methylase [Marinicella sp. NBU2979]